MTQDSKLIVCTQCATVNRTPVDRKLSDGKCAKCKSVLGPSQPIDISDKVFAKFQSRDQGAYVLDVWAPWCGPCRMMAPGYADSASKFEGDIRFLKLNSEQYPNTSSALNVRGIPALFFFNNGKLVAQKTGAMAETDITKWVKLQSVA